MEIGLSLAVTALSGSSPMARAISTLKKMFASGAQGAWYDVSDNALMYQDSAGTLPITAIEQPVGKVIDLSGRGNHALQSTTVNRPIISARYNLVTKSEALDNAAWSKTFGVTVVTNNTTAPDGTLTADKVTYNGTGTASAIRISVSALLSVLGIGYRASIWLRADSPVTVRMRGNNVAGAYVTCNLTSTWQRFTASGTGNGSTTIAVQIYSPSAINTPFNIYAWGAQAVSISELPSNNYQSIDTSTVYADTGFNKYLKLNGTNSHLATLAGGSGTAGVLFCQVIRLRGGAGSVRQIFTDAGANTGYKVCINASNNLELAAGDGVAVTAIATSATLFIGVNYLITAWDDGVNLKVQIGTGAIASIARPSVVAGVPVCTFGAASGGGSGWLPADTSSIVYYSGIPTPAQISSAQTYCKVKAGI